MTVINPNSVAGINSITVQSGNSLSVHKSNGELIRTLTSNSGVTTFSSISVGTATTDNSAAKSINIGLGASISQHVDNSLSFGTRGDERARLDANGRVLIGTTTEGHGNADDLTIATSANTGITIRSGTSNGGNIFFSDATSGTGEYAGMISYDHNDNIMTFATTDGSERLRITSTGSVGLGINNPTDHFHVYHATDNLVARFESGDTGGGITLKDNTHVTSLLTTNGAFEINVDQGGDITGETIAFKLSGTEKFRINSDGRIGINRTSPSGIIHALGNSTVGTSVTCLLQSDATANATSDITFFARDNSNNNEICRVRAASGGAETVSLQFHTADTERLRILASGRVAIGTDSASSSLQIYGSDEGEGTAKGQIILKDTAAYNASPQAGIVFQIHHASNNAQAIVGGIRGLKANASDSDYDGCLAFDVRKNGAVAYEAMRINEDGQLGIGTDNPGQTLHISAASGDVFNRVDTNVNGGMLVYVQGTQRSVFANDSAFSGTQTDTGIGAKGNLLFRTGTSSYTERVRIGTSGQIGLGGANYGTAGQVLTSNGSSSAVSWGSAGGIVPITATTVSSETSAVAFTEALTGAFDTYKIYIVMIDGMKFAADDRDLRVRYRTGSNGGTLATGSDYHSMTNGANNADDAFSAASFWRFNYNNISNVTVGSYIKGDFNAIIYFQGFEANRRLRYYGMTSYQSADGADRGQFISGMATDATEATGLEFFSSSGNIALGKFSLFGVNG